MLGTQAAWTPGGTQSVFWILQTLHEATSSPKDTVFAALNGREALELVQGAPLCTVCAQS
jgi:hypothetical protein